MTIHYLASSEDLIGAALIVDSLDKLLLTHIRQTGITTEQIADETGVSVANLLRLIRGHTPTVPVALRVLRWLGEQVPPAL